MESISFRSGVFRPGARPKSHGVAGRSLSAGLSILVLISLYWIGAAAGFSGLIGKWGLNDERAAALACAPPARASGDCDANHYDLAAMLDGDATRPWAYRVLIPWTANLADRYAHRPIEEASTAVSRFLGEERIENFSPSKTFAKTTGVRNPKYETRYAIVYYMCFLSILAFMFFMRRVLELLEYSPVTCAMAPFVFVIAWPYLMTVNGHYYDASELMFMALAMLCALSARSWWLPIVAVLGSFNKESFLLFVAALGPFYLGPGRRPPLAMLLVSLLACVGVDLYLRWLYAALPGSAIEWHALQNLKDYSSLWTYHQAELTYGVIGPQGVFVGSLVLIACICAAGWGGIDRRLRQHLLVSAALNFPLLLLFCVAGELRNLSFLFIGFIVLMAQTFENRLGASARGSARRETARLASVESHSVLAGAAIPLDRRA